MPARGMIIHSAAAIPRGNWFPRSGCRGAGDDDFPAAAAGREPWLTPYTDETLKMLGEKGVKHIQVMSLGSDLLKRWRNRRPEPGISFEAGGKKVNIFGA